MKEARSELKADAEDGGPPDFDALTSPEALVRGDRTRDDFFAAVLGLDSPATASEVADRAGHGADAAREYLSWFERLGIVTRVTESPATYRRNQEYLNWRRVQRLRDQYAAEELVELLESERERDETYAETFGVGSPEDVSITANASETDRPVEDVWGDVSSWKTTRRRIALLERAAVAHSGESATQRRVV
jgi:hypothetical protein